MRLRLPPLRRPIWGPGSSAIFTPSDAIFTALATRQVVRSTRADLTTTINDTTLAVATAYFNVQQARGELFGAQDGHPGRIAGRADQKFWRGTENSGASSCRLK